MDEIDQLSKSMEQESKALKNELFRFCWYMRGGMTISEAYELGYEEREIISKIIEDNLETTKKSGIPFF
jgi:hypothetical protein